MRLYPAPGLKVRDPRTRAFIDPAEGIEAGANDFDLIRMRRHGDLVEQPPAPKAPAPAPAPPEPPQRPAPAPIGDASQSTETKA
ncbi:MAG TPA: hypothetical protein VG248_17260 [Caulobacteraceae bacterium]|jgi:hypothetical protein|nr:hypothetical protein [Caulobacteraceae bacterium]